MSDAAVVNVIGQTAEHYVVHLASVSDGSGEAAVVKVDKSTLVAADGAEPASLDIERIQWNCDGMQARILWDHDTDDLAFVCSGFGELDFRGRDLDLVPKDCRLKDPRSTGGAGDILLTTSGHTSGDTYNITLWLRKASA